MSHPRFTVISVNVNGIRAAARRGGLGWLASRRADVITMQEVRATEGQLRAELVSAGMGDWHLAYAECGALGRAGVAVLSRARPLRVATTLRGRGFDGSGRWVEADIESPVGTLTVTSAYVHTGDAQDPIRQKEKYCFLDAIESRMRVLRSGHTLVTGDLNVAHHEIDIKNWKGNRKRAGFLPDERAYLTRWGKRGWVDLGRTLGGPGPGPYTWWSWRGRGFDTDGGWRIDFQLATPELAGRANAAQVGKAETYALRWSDHAPLTVTFD